MTALIFGASAGVGRALARALAARGHGLVLMARNIEDVQAEAAHARLVYGVEARAFGIDAVPVADLPAALAPILASEAIDIIAFPLGLADGADDALLEPRRIAALVEANLTAVMVVTGLFLPQMIAARRGSIIGFGSIAAIRGRGSNIAYAAAKRGLESYFESLRHRTQAFGVKVQFYRLGYVSTQMSFGMKLAFPAVSPAYVAEIVASRIGHDAGLRHVPGFWWFIAQALKAVPWPVFRRMKF